MSMGQLHIQNIGANYLEKKVLSHVSFRLNAGERLAVMGPSGCGKTTLLKMIAGLIEPSSGRIEGLEKNKIRLVFQEPRLLPWKTVNENILIAEGPLSAEKKTLYDELLVLSELTNDVSLYPNMLSGGMAQRVSLLRALVSQPNILLLDEAFSSLDRHLRKKIVRSFLNICLRFPQTTVFVTHQPEEAFELAERVVVLNGAPASIVSDLQLTDDMTLSEFTDWFDGQLDPAKT